VSSKQLEGLVNKVNQVLVDSINKDLEQYESEKELWNTEVQSKIADRIANKVTTLINSTEWLVDAEEKDDNEIQ
jgi:hypothetical protein